MVPSIRSVVDLESYPVPQCPGRVIPGREPGEPERGAQDPPSQSNAVGPRLTPLVPLEGTQGRAPEVKRKAKGKKFISFGKIRRVFESLGTCSREMGGILASF